MKKITFLPILLVMILGLVGIVSAGTCVVVSPGASAIITGATFEFNVSQSNTPGTGAHVANCTVSGSSALTSDTWTSPLLLNSSQGNWSNVTVSTIGEVDASDWSFTFTCMNSSAQTVDTCTRTGITIDNTIPVCGTASPVDNAKDTDGTVTFTQGCTNATAGTLFHESQSYSMTESADSCSYTDLRIFSNGFHSWYITITDGRNTTTCTTQQVEIRKPGSGIYLQQQAAADHQQQQASGGGNNGIFWFVALGAAIWYMSKQQGGTKNRRKRK